MNQTNYLNLLSQRANYSQSSQSVNGYEWVAHKMPLDTLYEKNQAMMGRVVNLALQLEIPVGNWISEAIKKNLVDDPVAKKLLLSNVGDETVHYKAFENLYHQYINKKDDEAVQLGKQWVDNKEHPVLKSFVAENGVFLITLTLMRLIEENESVFTVCVNVSKDEIRHIHTNRQVLEDLNYSFISPSLDKLRKDTVSYLVNGIPQKRKFEQASDDLMSTGRSKFLSRLTTVASELSPFESPNNALGY
jgi:hypothetical protein